ncbi:type I DNA topoisomerase, partial [Candidatus Collierbacteria bacterium]|nr:type I DNA topoisomerase [Candidatus Collierbacteria bacterium]
MRLIIVESPTKTKSLSKYLGADFEVMATMGHIRDLPKSKTGVEIKRGGKNGSYLFEPEYVLVEGKNEQVRKLKKAADKADEIILATDPDREGEAIAYHTQVLLKGTKDKFKRIVFHSITKEAILEAMESPRKVDMDLVNAQQARRVLDRIVGYKLSPILWKKVRRGLSAGRVQSVAVRLIVEKEKEIEVFKSEEYWTIKVEVRKAEGEEKFWTELYKIGGKAAKIGQEKQAEIAKEDLETAFYQVKSIEKKERKLYPHPPFKTSTLQQAAANVMGWSAKKTMSVAQRLYEMGAITYHRTDSLNLAPQAVAKIREQIVKKYGQEYLALKEVYYKTSGKVVAQEAHEAIRPTRIEGESEEMDKDQAKLYELIFRRTIACQMGPAIVDQTNVVVDAIKDHRVYELRSTGEIVKFASWKKLYKGLENVELPDLVEKEKLVKEKVAALQKFTQPPARYNDASLIRELEKRGIGRPS